MIRESRSGKPRVEGNVCISSKLNLLNTFGFVLSFSLVVIICWEIRFTFLVLKRVPLLLYVCPFLILTFTIHPAWVVRFVCLSGRRVLFLRFESGLQAFSHKFFHGKSLSKWTNINKPFEWMILIPWKFDYWLPFAISISIIRKLGIELIWNIHCTLCTHRIWGACVG